MSSTLSLLPGEFWVIVVLLVIGLLASLASIRQGCGIPLAIVLATVTIWYLVDVFYNDYQHYYLVIFPQSVLNTAWQQIVIFLAALLPLTFLVHGIVNARYRRRKSFAWEMVTRGVHNQQFQRNLTLLLKGAIGVWIFLMIGALFRYNTSFFFFLFPYLGKHPGPWVTSGLASGTDSLLALANYLHMMTGSIFGVIAALSKNPRTRRIALLGMALSWPLYLFDRTRGFILILTVPGVLAWVFIRIRGSAVKKAAVLAVMFLMVNAWFGFIISARSSGVSVTNMFLQDKFNFGESSSERHQGLNMFEELSWITHLTRTGRFNPDTGANYFANLVNPIPRFFWPSKPTIGIDYAKARGMGGAKTAVGVYATLSNGLIGQGVVNFGLYSGAVFAAFLMSLWIAFLARLDLTGTKIGHAALYGLGLITTFTLGRDITFINLYPVVFGYLICRYLNYRDVIRSARLAGRRLSV